MILRGVAGCVLLLCVAHAPQANRLTDAATRGDVVSMRKLLDAGVRADAVDARGRTALQAAIENGPWVVRSSGAPGLSRPRLLAVARLLLERGADPNRRVRHGSPLMIASGTDFTELAVLLLRHRADPMAVDQRGESALGHAASPEMVRLLLRHGASIDRLGASAMLSAAKRRHLSALTGLIAADPAAASHGRQALVWSVSDGYLEIARELLRAGIDANTRTDYGDPLISLAVQNGHTAMAAELLRYGAGIHARDSAGRTPLHRAATPMVRWLLDRGASVTARDHQGETPLFSSISTPAAVELLATRESVNLRDNHGQTALYVAAQRGHPGSVGILLDRGADPNIADAFRMTPLHAAVLRGAHFRQQKLSPIFPNMEQWRRQRDTEYVETIRMLLRHGARRDTRSWNGHTPLDIAKKHGYHVAAKLLTAAGAGSRTPTSRR